MTKTKMRAFLRYKLNQLDKTMEPEKFYTRVDELFYKLRRIPVKETEQEHFDNSMDKWQEHFLGYGITVKFHHEMRKRSLDKRYYKPSLGPRFKKSSYELINIHIMFSLLPK